VSPTTVWEAMGKSGRRGKDYLYPIPKLQTDLSLSFLTSFWI